MWEHMEILESVKRIVADAADYPLEKVALDDNIYLEYGLDSLGAVAIMVELNEMFGVPEPKSEPEFRELSTVRKLVEYVVVHEG